MLPSQLLSDTVPQEWDFEHIQRLTALALTKNQFEVNAP